MSQKYQALTALIVLYALLGVVVEIFWKQPKQMLIWTIVVTVLWAVFPHVRNYMVDRNDRSKS
jgi:uncharacterized membrane protein YeiB